MIVARSPLFNLASTDAYYLLKDLQYLLITRQVPIIEKTGIFTEGWSMYHPFHRCSINFAISLNTEQKLCHIGICKYYKYIYSFYSGQISEILINNEQVVFYEMLQEEARLSYHQIVTDIISRLPQPD